MSAPRCERVIGVAAAEFRRTRRREKEGAFPSERRSGAWNAGGREGRKRRRSNVAFTWAAAAEKLSARLSNSFFFWAAHAVAEQGSCCSGVYGRWGVRKEGVMGVSFLQAFLGVFLLFFSVRFPPSSSCA